MLWYMIIRATNAEKLQDVLVDQVCRYIFQQVATRVTSLVHATFKQVYYLIVICSLPL